ncbi:PilZ domain-containing protein [Gudongella oleilytica]|jgi:c-di-GMP-binding flagellar brake protein YcgR|uniref:flagellar brake protein n=1 Tax=Gudongella oleilytica TaxID=1582259 RepID=UPI002A35EA58|nr:PilZ domain-containing protein [Gudongella oleilytica]MDY0256575.1 PilZ domain-containing protein [Gudongella oleilytica]
MKIEKFQLNSKVEIINSDGRGMQGMLYDTETDSVIVSVVPSSQGFSLLRIGEELEVVIYDIKNLVTFQGVLSGRESGDFMLYKIRAISELKKFQRREYVRIAYTGAIRYSFEPEHLNTSSNGLERRMREEGSLKGFTEARGIDLSGGGVRFKTYEKLRIGQSLALILRLDDDTLIVKGEVRHGYTDITEGRAVYCYGIMFTDTTELKTDTIVKHVFLMMRKSRML